jgi:VanZ family protein
VEVVTFGSNAEQWGNVLLFLPLGLLGALVSRSVPRAAGFGVVLSVLVEVWQSAAGRGGEVSDVLHTAAGAVLGAVSAAVVLRIRRPRRRAAADVGE